MSKQLTDKRIVLVGGAGFIGHHLALALKQRGCHVEIVDSLQVNNLLSVTNGKPVTVNRELYLRMIDERLTRLREADVPLHTQDARDYHALSHLLGDIRPNIIVHLAAVAHAGASNKDPHSTFDHSLRTLENALDNARSPALEVKRFVYFSSSMVYGNFREEQVTEDTPCDPVGIYGALKFAGERIVIAYNQVFDLPYTIIRPSALYGERCISRRVAQIFIENALAGRPVCVEGDGSDRLDFTYVGDLVSGVINAMAAPGAVNETFNLTYGQSRSLGDLAEILVGQFPGLDVSYGVRDRLTPRRGTLCVDKARRLVGYDPQHPLERGMARYIDWYRELVHAPCAVG